MPKLLHLRVLSAEEEREIARLARSRTTPVRLVEWARIVALGRHGQRVPAIAEELRISAPVVRRWLQHFNERGLEGLADAPRSGRPATYTAEEVGKLIAASLTDRRTWGCPWPVGRETGWQRTCTRPRTLP